MPSQQQEAVPHRAIITVCAMLATLMQSLDSTIANVALPYMQGSLSASSDQITWVLTSYITAAAIMTAPVGWLSARFGLKRLYLISMIGFTGASMLCGVAGTLPEMVGFRLLQGVFGAALVPLSQTTMLNIYPPEKRGSAMAIWGMGVMVGPILGPTLGGYLTELYNWRWVFFVNLPFGMLATAGMAAFLPKTNAGSGMKFDWFGFGVFAMGIAGFQLMLDRGETQDWFGSSEIIIEAVIAGLGFYLFVVHMFTAPKPFITPAVFKDRNLSAGLLVMFAVGMVLLSVSALLAPWLQELGNYPVETAGLMMAPRGFGTMAAMLIAGRLSNKVDARLLMAFGIVVTILELVPDDGLDARRIGDHDGGEHDLARCGIGVRVHSVTGDRVRDLGSGVTDRGHGVTEPVAKCRQRDRNFGDGRDGDAEWADRAFGAGGIYHAAEPGVSGRRCGFDADDGSRGSDAQWNSQPSGGDHRL